MSDSETGTQLPISSDFDVDWDGVSRLKINMRSPSSQRDCVNTSHTLAKQSSNSTYIAGDIYVKFEQSPYSSINIGNNERFPTYVIPNEIPAAIKKPSLLKSPVATTNLNQAANRPFHFTANSRCFHHFHNSSPTVMAVDWGDDNEWILLFDNLLKSHPTCTSYNKQHNMDMHGNWHGRLFFCKCF